MYNCSTWTLQLWRHSAFWRLPSYSRFVQVEFCQGEWLGEIQFDSCMGLHIVFFKKLTATTLKMTSFCGRGCEGVTFSTQLYALTRICHFSILCSKAHQGDTRYLHLARTRHALTAPFLVLYLTYRLLFHSGVSVSTRVPSLHGNLPIS